MNAVLLLSGGLDSSALAGWKRPAVCLMVDYGQRAAQAEKRAATSVCDYLELTLEHLTVDCSTLGQGTLAGRPPSERSEWQEFWPYRNQLLVTFAAGWAIQRGIHEIWTGSIRTDDRHVDGTAEFYAHLSTLVCMQEGNLTVSAPAIELTCDELVTVSKLDDRTLASTYSCHSGDSACNVCSGCEKRAGVLWKLGRLQSSTE